MRLWLLLIPFMLGSCFLLGPHFKKSEFTYTENNVQQTIPLILPPGYTSQKTMTDSAGNMHIVYQYGKGYYYVSYVNDTLQQNPFIDTSMNIPRVHPLGGLIYKGINEDGRYWREIRRQHLRYGYRDINKGSEYLFDSATNYASGLRPK